MSVEMRNIFSTDAMSVAAFLAARGQCCYIPVYQRHYAWRQANITRLRDDVLGGISQLSERAETINFIGTIIAIHDTKYASIQPCYRRDVPSKVMTVIDGQQRICTAIMFNIALHDYLRRHSAYTLIQESKDSHMVWIRDECAQLLADLRETYVFELARSTEKYRNYPRVIRGYRRRVVGGGRSGRSTTVRCETGLGVPRAHGIRQNNEVSFRPVDDGGRTFSGTDSLVMHSRRSRTRSSRSARFRRAVRMLRTAYWTADTVLAGRYFWRADVRRCPRGPQAGGSREITIAWRGWSGERCLLGISIRGLPLSSSRRLTKTMRLTCSRR